MAECPMLEAHRARIRWTWEPELRDDDAVSSIRSAQNCRRIDGIGTGITAYVDLSIFQALQEPAGGHAGRCGCPAGHVPGHPARCDEDRRNAGATRMARREGHYGDDAGFSSTTRGAHALAGPERLRVRCLTAMRALARKWRNWQTRRIQDRAH